jgi:hypothetical protein
MIRLRAVSTLTAELGFSHLHTLASAGLRVYVSFTGLKPPYAHKSTVMGVMMPGQNNHSVWLAQEENMYTIELHNIIEVHIDAPRITVLSSAFLDKERYVVEIYKA